MTLAYSDSTLTPAQLRTLEHWRQAWPDDARLFVELAVGCRTPCAYRCASARVPVRVGGRDLLWLSWLFWRQIPSARVTLYGRGDVTEYPWENTRPIGDDAFRRACEVTIDEGATRSKVEHIRAHFAERVWMKVSTERGAEAAVALDDLIFGVSVPGLSTVPLRSILRRTAGRLDTVIVAGTSNDRADYLPRERVVEDFRAVGVEPHASDVTSYGYNPILIDSIRTSEVEVAARVGTWLDAQQMGTTYLQKFVRQSGGDWLPRGDGEHYKRAAGFAASRTDRQNKGRWYAWHERAVLDEPDGGDK